MSEWLRFIGSVLWLVIRVVLVNIARIAVAVVVASASDPLGIVMQMPHTIFSAWKNPWQKTVCVYELAIGV